MGIVIVFRQTWAVIQTVRRESESYSGEEVQGLTVKVFGGDFDPVRTNWSFPENCEPMLQTPRGPANVEFRPRTLAVAKRCRFESYFLSKRAGKCNLDSCGAGSTTRAFLRNTCFFFRTSQKQGGAPSRPSVNWKVRGAKVRGVRRLTGTV